MKNTRKKDDAKRLPQNFIEAAASFETTRIEQIKKTSKIAWTIAIVSTAICGISILAFLVALLMRTEPEPVILKVDNSTGATSVMRSVRDTQDHYDDVINKYWLAMYVRTCEAYDWYAINDAFAACKLMSSSPVESEYSRRVRDKNSPLNVLKDKGKIVVNVSSISFIGAAAQVRFTTEKLNESGDNVDGSPVQKWIATVSFIFDPKLKMTEQQRLINPLGFKVMSYRIDREA